MANGKADHALQDTARGSRCLFHHAGCETMHRHLEHLEGQIEPMFAECPTLCKLARTVQTEHRPSSPPWRWTCFGLLPSGHPEFELHLLGDVGLLGVFAFVTSAHVRF